MSKLSRSQIREAAEMRAAGVAMYRIGRHLGVDAQTVARVIEPGWAERRSADIRARKREQARADATVARVGHGRMHKDNQFRPSEEDFQRGLALIPPDTRDNTGVLMGDPLPNDPRRSARA